LFKNRESTQVEAEYSDKSKNIIIDRLFIEDSVLWIIDFKTASPTKDESIDTFIERQKNSHREQLLEYQEILKNFFKLPTKLALYCPAISQLIYLDEDKQSKYAIGKTIVDKDDGKGVIKDVEKKVK
jgi:ATP-dependent exoDNAse (exonuclease V) beta subunit